MVQVIDDPTRGGIFGRIGKGLGQGLSEQLPKEVERHRLSSGLRDLAKNAGNMTPLQQATNYLSIPGITPAAIQILPDLLRQEGIKSSGPIPEQVGNSGSHQSSGQNTNAKMPTKSAKDIGKASTGNIFINKPENNYDNQFRSLTSAEDINLQKAPIGTEAELETRAFELTKQYPGRFRTLEEGRAKAEAEQQSKLNQFEASRQRRLANLNTQNATLDAYKNARQTYLQKQGPETYIDLPGETQKVFEQIALDKVANGKVPEAAGEDTAKEEFDFVKNRGSLKGLGRESFSKASPQMIKDLKSIGNEYIKYNQRPLFVKDAQQFNGIGPHLASSIIYDTSPGLQKIEPLIKGKVSGGHETKRIIGDIAKNIGNQDSIFKLGMTLNENDWNDQEVINDLNRRAILGEWKPTDDQQREMNEYTPLDFSLGDIFFTTLMELRGEKGKVSSQEKIRRKIWGKR